MIKSVITGVKLCCYYSNKGLQVYTNTTNLMNLSKRLLLFLLNKITVLNSKASIATVK